MVNVISIHKHRPLHQLLDAGDYVHPNIVSFTECYEDCGMMRWLILDYMRGDWLNNVVARNALGEDHVACIASDVCSVFPLRNIYT